MSALLDSLSVLPVLAGGFVIFVAYTLYTSFTRKSAVPDNLPWIGKPPSNIFPETRATFASFGNVRHWLAEGYAKYSKNQLSYIFPDFSGRPELIIPNGQLPWLLSHPDNIISVTAVHYEQLEAKYAFTDPRLIKEVFHEHVTHKALARNLSSLLPDIWDELAHFFDETWGTEQGVTREIVVSENMMAMIARASNRMFVGLPLCRNDEYLSNMGKFASDVITSMTLLSFIPRMLKPIFGPLFTLPNHWHYRKTAKYTVPLFKRRLAQIEAAGKDAVPNDYVTWYINVAKAEGRTLELDPVLASRYLMPINFAAIHTTTFTITNTLFDLLGS
ncbi:hypothetical protein LTR66_008721, partial [Elasticomyces elasticus]